MSRSIALPGISVFLAVFAALLAPTGFANAQERIELPGPDSPLTLDVQEVYSVGSLAGDEWETFSRVTGVAFDKDGNLYLLDVDNFRVVKVGPDGSLVTEMGGEGGGPGEFGMPLAFSVTREGEVRVFDVGYGGFSVFHPDGSYKTSVPMDPGTMLFPSGGLLSHPDGGILSPGGGVVGMRRTVGGEMGFPATLPVHLFSLADQIEVDTIFEAWNPATAEGPPDLETTGGGGIRFQAPPMRAFDPEVRAGVFPDGRIALVDSTTYEVKVMTLGGEVQQLIRRPFAPREVTRQDREAEKNRRKQEMAASGGPRIVMRTDQGTTGSMASSQAKAMMEARLETMVFATEIPVVAEMAVDWEGRIWVGRSGSGVGEAGPTDLIDSTGAYLGSLSPRRVESPMPSGPEGSRPSSIGTSSMFPGVVVRRLAIR